MESPGQGGGGGGRAGGLPPHSGRYVKSESTQSPDSGHFGHPISTDSGNFSHDISRMPDFPPRNPGHRRAHSEILSLPDDISFDSELGFAGSAEGPSLSDETEEDLFSMYLDLEKLGSSCATSGSVLFTGESSSAAAAGATAGTGATAMTLPDENAVASSSHQRPRIRHQHSLSMDGSTSIKPELLVSGTEGASLAEAKKAMSAAKLADLALIDPKRAKRIWANRQSAARSKERKMRYISELERKVQTLQTEATTLSAQLTMLQRDTNGLTAENNELKLRLQTMEQQVHLQDALNDALREEVQRLKLMTGQAIPNGGQVTNFGSHQQFYPNNQAMHTILAAHQFQQLQIHSQQQQQHQQLLQHQQLQPPQQQTADLKNKRALSSPNQRENTSNIDNGAKE